MLIAGLVVGFAAGLVAGGRPANLLRVRLRWPLLILAALILRYGTELALDGGLPAAEALRVPLLALGFVILVGALFANRNLPGLLVAAAGIASNAAVILVNAGRMPVWAPALQMAGFSPADLSPSLDSLLPAPLDAAFLSRAGFLGDVLPVPLGPLANVYSVGDVVMALGLAWFLFATLARERPEDSWATEALAADTGGTGTVRLGRLAVLGGAAAGGLVPVGGRPGRGAPAVLGRVAGHPYIRLALDARFSALWLGQTISLFGDRLNQVALGVMVFVATGSPLATGLVFLVAALPNLLLGPIAGTFVDRWDQKAVLVMGDLLRGALVLIMPVVAARDIRLVYPIVFLVTCASVFFRPAKDAVIPRIVAADDLMAANSANWIGETLADIAGYPLAGAFVALLGSSIRLAFWVDAGTYLLSAALVLGLLIPPVTRVATATTGGAVRRFLQELREGWRFLRGSPPLFQNTLVTAVAQTSFGVELALTVVYARTILDGTVVAFPANYSLIDAAIGVGNFVGGLGLGLIGTRTRKGPLIAAGVGLVGISVILMGLTRSIVVAAAAAAVMGVANLVFIIPTQTLFAELTPRGLMGRVVAMRSSLVYGAMLIAMGLASAAADVLPVSSVFVAFGVVTTGCGVVAYLLPAVRRS